MIPENAIIESARDLAETHDIKYPHKVCAIIYDKRRTIVGVGLNKPHKTHPKANTPYKTIHAEFAAILDAERSYGLSGRKGLSIYVHRVRRDGKDGMSKPCRYCSVALSWAGVENVYWSVNDDDR